MSMILKPFAKQEDVQRQRAAAEATPITIPFQSPSHLHLSGGKSDRCFFLKSKVTGEVFPWNAVMAESGNVHFMPVYDDELLMRPEYSGEVKVWLTQNAIPAVLRAEVIAAHGLNAPQDKQAEKKALPVKKSVAVPEPVVSTVTTGFE